MDFIHAFNMPKYFSFFSSSHPRIHSYSYTIFIDIVDIKSFLRAALYAPLHAAFHTLLFLYLLHLLLTNFSWNTPEKYCSL